jgi:hypothetical protein
MRGGMALARALLLTWLRTRVAIRTRLSLARKLGEDAVRSAAVAPLVMGVQGAARGQ